MSRRLAVALLALATFTLADAGIAQEADDSGPPRILVTFADPGMSNAARAGPAGPGYSRRTASYLVSVGVKRAASRIAREFALEVVDEWPIVPLKVHCLVYSVPGGASVDELLGRLRQRPEVESAQLLNRFEVLGTSGAATADPYAALQHNLQTLEVAAAHSWSRGDGASVTIVDTGADFNHPELRSRIRQHRDFVGNDDAVFAADAHGTAVAGVIAAAENNGLGVVGVAPSASLTVLKACWYDGGGAGAVCDSFTLAKALTFALESGTDVINLSLGGPSDGLLARIVGLALDSGIVVVAAAPASSPGGFPSDVPGVIVANSGGEPAREPGLQLSAPGDDILVPVPGGGFDYSSGNSLSAAQVSGVAALLIARQPRLTGDEIGALLANSRAAAGEPINACRALASLLHVSGCRPAQDPGGPATATSESGGQAHNQL